MQVSDLPLNGAVALVTGANRGIGAATAVALAERGAEVAITYLRVADPNRNDPFNQARASDGTATARAIEAIGRRCHRIEADLADVAIPAALFDEVEANLGVVSVLVHNASGWHKNSFDPDHVDAVGRRSDASDGGVH